MKQMVSDTISRARNDPDYAQELDTRCKRLEKEKLPAAQARP